jgi:dTMP kinase
MDKNKGKLIVIEGLDGSGKTEVINRLKMDFPKFVYTREPGGTVFGEMIRSVLLESKSKNVPPLPMLLGFMSSRASHVQELIVPSVKKGINIVSDRFDTSTFAFQLFGQQNMDLEKIFWYLRKNIIEDLKINYIYLRITPEIARARSKSRNGNNHFDKQTKHYHKRVFDGYESFFGKVKCCKIDASRDKESVYRDVYSHIKKLVSK